jgi:small subunit ribosomal protein S1
VVVTISEEAAPAAVPDEAQAETSGEAVSASDTAEVEVTISDEAVSATETAEMAAQVADESAAAPQGEAAWFDESGAMPRQFKRGELVEGVITRTSPTAVMVDIGAKTEGVIPGRELERMSRQVIESLREGEKITVYVVNPHDHQGDIVLSVNRASKNWTGSRPKPIATARTCTKGQVAGTTRRLIVRFGRLRGFVPQSQVGGAARRLMAGETPEERYGPMVNEPISVKVMEVDRSRNRLILSERLASREVREKRKESLVSNLSVGEVRVGRVVSLEDFGAFVDIGGAEGLVHLTELSWKHVTHPKDVLKVGQEVRVEVISIDRERKRIGLSIKRQEADPWDEVATEYNVGQLVQAVVTKLTKFGAFARLVDAPDIEGLVHISELSDQRVAHPREMVNEGDKLTLRVVKIDVKNRRLGLSLKRVNSAEYLDMDWTFAADSNTE